MKMSEGEYAASFLRGVLSKGPIASKEVLRQADSIGIAERSLWRGKRLAGVKAIKSGYSPSYWIWKLDE